MIQSAYRYMNHLTPLDGNGYIASSGIRALRPTAEGGQGLIRQSIRPVSDIILFREHKILSQQTTDFCKWIYCSHNVCDILVFKNYSFPRRGGIPPGNKYNVNSKVGWIDPKCRYGRVWRKKKSLALSGSKLRTVQPVVCRYPVFWYVVRINLIVIGRFNCHFFPL